MSIEQKDSKDPEAQCIPSIQSLWSLDNDKDIEINDIELQRFIQEKIKQTTESIQKDVYIQRLCSSLERQRDKRECGIEGASLPLWQQGYQTFPVIVQMCSAEYPLILLFTL